MIGVNRRVYRDGVYQGQDLFDQRTSLIQYAELFNAFPEVTFCVSVLSSGQNQELASYSWIFPNVVTSGHWWYSNIPAYIEQDARARLQAVPKTKQIGYYSDMYKLEFGLPKYNMYRRVLAKVLADDFVRSGATTESGGGGTGPAAAARKRGGSSKCKCRAECVSPMNIHAVGDFMRNQDATLSARIRLSPAASWSKYLASGCRMMPKPVVWPGWR